MKPASRRKHVRLDVCPEKDHRISLCPGGRPYLWIGSETKGCFGCVPDSQVEKLRDMCNAILLRRSFEMNK